MIIVDRALEKREAEGKPIRVGMIGAGYMGIGIALQYLTPLTGQRMVAIANRTVDNAEKIYRDAGADTSRVSSVAELEKAIDEGKYSVTDDPSLLCQAGNIDLIIESTGEIEFGSKYVLEAMEHGKHVVLMNAELDATVGPILKVKADKAGVVITNTDGDEPGVAMNLVRFARSLGYEPKVTGNLKGMLDHYRTPETQREFAEKYNQKPKLITSFADGTKLSMETTVLANGSGFGVAKRGMNGHPCDHVNDSLKLFSLDQIPGDGIVDYLLGAAPYTGAFVLAYNEHPVKAQYMNYFKMGDGPLYLFYTPYHLPHLQLASTAARAALFADATVAPVGKPMTDVITMAKRDLKAGERLDGIGGFTCYGDIDNYDTARSENLLPMGLCEDCVLKVDVPKDHAISYEEVEVPADRLGDKLREEQTAYFASK